MRGQVSLIAIIGVLLVLVTIGFFVVFNQSKPANAKGFQDLEVALSGCLEQQAQALLPIAAAHGGELAYAFADPSSVGVRAITDDRGSLIPVWVEFDGACTSDCLRYSRPKLSPNDVGGGPALSIEEQLETTLDPLVSQCLAARAKELNVTAQVRGVKTRVSIGDTIDLSADVRGSFSRDGRSADRLSGTATIDSSFLELFNTAKTLAQLEAHNGLFGAYVNDIIAVGSGIDAPYPPLYAYDFSYATHVWTAQGVSEKLRADLKKYLPLVQLASSKTPAPADLPYVVRRGVVDLTRDGSRVGDGVFLNVEPAGPPMVKLNGGQIASGQGVGSVIPIVGNLVPVRRYQTSYDVTSPLVLTLTSRTDGLAFRFAIEPRIKNNRVLRSDTHSYSLSSGADGAGLTLASKAYCDDPTGSLVSVSLHGSSADETSLLYRCGSLSCTYPFSTSLTLPTCVGGTLEAQAPNVRFDPTRIDSTSGSVGSASFTARERHDVSVDARVIETRPQIDQTGKPIALVPGAARDLGPNERMVVRFEGLDSDYTAAAVVTKDDSSQVPLYDGTYSVSVDIMRDVDEAHKVVIPARTDCPLLFCFLAKADIPEVKFNETLVLGQYQDLGPIYVNSNDPVSIELPIFDLAKISETNRRVEDLTYYDLLPDALASSSGGVSS